MASKSSDERTFGLADYVRAFSAFQPPSNEKSTLKDKAIETTEQRFKSWREGATANSQAFVGRPGSAGPMAMTQLQQSFCKHLKCTRVSLERYAIAHDGLAGALGQVLGVGRTADVEALIKAAAEGDRQVVFIEECHNLFIRRIGGFAPLYELEHLMTATSNSIFWMTLWSPHTWYYLDKILGFSHFFDAVVSYGSLSADIIERWVYLKHNATGFSATFPAGEAPKGRLLPSTLQSKFKAAHYGDLEAAETIWLDSLELTGEKKVQVENITSFSSDVLETLREEQLYILCSLLYHGDMTIEYLSEDMNHTALDTRQYIDHLTDKAITAQTKTKTNGCYYILPQAIPYVVNLLDTKNLLNAKEPYGA